jgi:cytochrome c peroxidase
MRVLIKLRIMLVLSVSMLMLCLTACNNETNSKQEVSATATEQSAWPITPLPEKNVVNSAKTELGQRLFNDTRLSGNGKISCATCHDLQSAGVDHLPTSIGVGGRTAGRNAPSVFNTTFNFSQFWDGRAASLEEQAGGPILNPNEMSSSWQQVIAILEADKDYSQRFSEVYSSRITPANVTDAIAAFERTLVTPNAPFDLYLRGDKSALSPAANEGWRLFRERGCIACHQGMNVGGNMFQTFGVMGDFFRDRGKDDALDQGRYNVTHLEKDRHVFKVPSLRNVAHTAPYFHDGSVQTLQETILIMGRYQLGVDLSPTEVDAINAFLDSLSGCYQGRCL